MKNNNYTKTIFSEKTLRLKTKLITLSIISLFIGITKIIPHEFKLIGVNLPPDDRTLGWFILVATVVMLLFFLMNAYVEMQEYNMPEIIKNKTKELNDRLEYWYPSRNVMDLTEEEIESLEEEVENIKKEVISMHVKFKKTITFVFEFVLPVCLAMSGIYFLFSFLIV